MEEEVEVEAEVEVRNVEVLAMEKGGEGWQVSSLLLKEMPLAVYGFKKASLINDSFISEVKSRQRQRPRRRGGCLSPLRKLHGKNILKCISKTVP